MKRPHYIALGLVVVFTLTILNLPPETTNRLKLVVGSVFLPLFGITTAAHETAEKAGNAVVPRRELLKQNEALRLENQTLRLQAAQSESIAHENTRLRELAGWQQQQRWKLKLARVVLREPANWWRTVQIDLGSRDGIKMNMPVLTPEGLVGRVASVSLTRAQIVLLGDPACKVAARIENEARDNGVIGTASSLNSGLVEMSYLSKNAKIKPGQRVFTSGLGGIFPKDILIGTIVEAQPVEFGLYTEAQVRLGANVSALEELFVLVTQ